MNTSAEGSVEQNRQRWILVGVRISTVGLGALSAWTWRNTPNPDGISYVDVSTHYLEGNWPLSTSGYWSPLYPSLLALARFVGDAEVVNAWMIAHVVNFALFLGGIAGAEYLIRSVREVTPRDDPEYSERMFTWTVLVYLLVVWTSLSGLILQLITPDVAVASLVYLAAGLSVRIAHSENRVQLWFALGAVLGLGYLAKTAMLPIGVAVIATVAIATRHHGGWRRGVMAASTVFVLTCLPQVSYVSRLKGAPTIGDVGRLTYGWYMAGVPTPLWEIGLGGLPAALPSPNAGPQELRILDGSAAHPAVYSVDGPFPGTLPIWYDATYWYRNVRVPVALRKMVAGAASNVFSYSRLLFPFFVAALVALITWRLRSRAKTRFRAHEAQSAPGSLVLVAPASFALLLYAVSHWELRFIAPFVVLFLSGMVLPAATTRLTDPLRKGFMFAAMLLVAVTAYGTLSQFKHRSYYELLHAERFALIEGLRARSVRAGTPIGLVGYPYTAYWAQLGGLRFVSVIPSQEAAAFWAADSVARESVLRRMRDHGAAAIIALSPGIEPLPSGWIPVTADSSVLLRASRVTDRAASSGSRR
jgi:hypothetical protein